MIRVLLVDDHHLVRAGVKSLLESCDAIQIVGEACCGEEALEFAAHHDIDIAVLDIQMPGMAVEELIQKLQNFSPAICSVILTSANEETLTTSLINNGAFAYVTKSCDSEHLLQAIQKAAAGERYISPDIAKRLAHKVLHHAETMSKPNTSPFQSLSQREMQCLILIAKGNSIKEIATALDINPKTINTYRYRIFQKLHITSDVELIKLVTRSKLLEE